jgi:hypothetical protein
MLSDALPQNNDQANWARPLFERQVAMLGQLAEAGLAIALALKDQALETGAEGAEACARAYARTARAVRLTLMLQSQVIKQMQALDSHGAYLASCVARQDATDRDDLVEERKARVERIVERIVKDEHDDADHIERLVEETCERLDHDDLYGDLLSRPVSELVALICKDLGLDPDWSNLAREACAREDIISGLPWPPVLMKAIPPPTAEEFDAPSAFQITRPRGPPLPHSDTPAAPPRCG